MKERRADEQQMATRLRTQAPVFGVHRNCRENANQLIGFDQQRSQGGLWSQLCVSDDPKPVVCFPCLSK